MLKGAVAGAVATWVMDRADCYMDDYEDDDSRRQTWAVRPRHMDPAHVMAAKGAEVFGAELPTRRLDQAGDVVHDALGIAPAVIYGATRTRVPAIAPDAGWPSLTPIPRSYGRHTLDDAQALLALCAIIG